MWENTTYHINQRWGFSSLEACCGSVPLIASMDSFAAEPEFHDVLPEDQLPMTLTAESLDHVVIAWGAEYSYDGNFSQVALMIARMLMKRI